MEAKLNKGTTTVGIVCKDGIVLAADKRTSAGYLIADKKTEKVKKVSDHMAITTAGLVSDAQLFTRAKRQGSGSSPCHNVLQQHKETQHVPEHCRIPAWRR